MKKKTGIVYKYFSTCILKGCELQHEYVLLTSIANEEAELPFYSKTPLRYAGLIPSVNEVFSSLNQQTYSQIFPY